jgi:PTS hybrid protein
MIGIVIVAHSHQLAEGVKELADQMTQGPVCIAAAGGLDEETLGTNADRIRHAIEEVYSPDGVLVLVDLGSAVLSTEMAIEALPVECQRDVLLSDAPLVEGAVVAAIEASIGRGLAEVNAAALAAKEMQKIIR